jgi:hypothetical protein
LIFLHDLHQTARDDEEDPPDHFAAVVGFRQIDPSVSNPVIEGPSQPRLNSMQQHRKRTYTISGISPSHSSAGGTGTSIPWPHILSDSFSSVDKTVTKQHPHIYQCSSISIPRSLLTRIFPSLSTPKTRQFLRSPRHIPPPAGFSPIPQQTPLPIATQRSFEQAGLQENEAAAGKCAASHALSSSPDDSDQDIPCYSATAAGMCGPTNLLEILEHIAKVTLLAVSYCSCWHGVREGVVGGTSNFRVA